MLNEERSLLLTKKEKTLLSHQVIIYKMKMDKHSTFLALGLKFSVLSYMKITRRHRRNTVLFEMRDSTNLPDSLLYFDFLTCKEVSKTHLGPSRGA